MIEGVEDPPEVRYPTHAECEEAARKISEQYDWIHWIRQGDNAQLEAPVYGPSVDCREDLDDQLKSDN